jgi:DNA polymerase III epsilon subunit-like protein
MMYPIFDIEGDSLTATKIHCLSVNDGKRIKTTTDYDNMRKFFLKADVLIGHNIARWDIPTVERILEIKIPCKHVIDTLAISWYMSPDRAKHGLESYGVEYGLLKTEIEDWVGLDIKEYIRRCERDVEINTRLWEEQLAFLRKLYGNDQEVERLLAYLRLKMDCAALQEASRWKLDVPACQAGITMLEETKVQKTQELRAIMPRVPVFTTKTKPKKMFLQNGKLSSLGLKWKDLCQEYNADPETTNEITYQSGDTDPNPGSHDQMKNFLFSLGWKPDEFKYVPDKDNPKKTRAIPQINTKVPGEWGLSQSVQRLVEKHPNLEPLDGLSVITHRLSILEGFISNVDSEGYVKAEMQGLTNTLRYKHKTCVNLPKPSVPYGELIRGCLIAPDGMELCGSDMSSLEDKMKQHFMVPYDPEYVAEMQVEGYDPHLNLAAFAGAITKDVELQIRAGDKALKKLVKGIRDAYKTTNYACQYGAGGPKVALSAGLSKDEGYKLHKAYWDRNWSIKAISEDCITKTVEGSMWLWNPIAKLWYSLRNDKDRFSTLCQGSGDYCFNVWLKHVLSKRKQLTAQFHDEGVWTVRKGFREQCTELLTWAINETNKELNLNVKLGIDIQFGDRYSEIH